VRNVSLLLDQPITSMPAVFAMGLISPVVIERSWIPCGSVYARNVPSAASMSTVVAVPAFTTSDAPLCSARAAISAAQRSGPSISGRS